MSSDHMTFPDDETLLRIFGGPMPVPVEPWTGFNKIKARPSEMLLNGERLDGILVYVSSKGLDQYYRRFLDIPSDQIPQPDQAFHSVALVHQTQGVSWAPGKDFEEIVAEVGQQCNYVAITDNAINFGVDQKYHVAFLGGIHGHQGKFGCVLPYPDDLILAILNGADFIKSLSTFENPASRAKVYHNDNEYRLATVKDEVLRPCYALHLPHIEVDNCFWLVDAKALASTPSYPQLGAAEAASIVWEEHEVGEQDGGGGGGDCSSHRDQP